MLLKSKDRKFSDTMLLMLVQTHGELTMKKLEVELDRLVNAKKLLPVVSDKVSYVIEEEFKAGINHQHQLFSNLLDNEMINVAFKPSCSRCGFSMNKEKVSGNSFSFKCLNELCLCETTFTLTQTHVDGDV